MSSRRKLVAPVVPGLDELAKRGVDAPAPIVAPSPVQAEPSVAIREVLGYPQCLFAELPLATTLLISTHEGGRLCWTTSRTAYEAALAAQVPVFVGTEVSAMALTAEAERAAPAVLQGWCAEKLREPGFRVTERNAVDLEERRPAQGWLVGQVLRAFGAELVQVCVGSEVPAWG